jgi:hypothetical protein
MKKSLVLIAAFAMTTLFAQANDMEKMEATVEKVMQEAIEAASEPQTDIAPAPEAEKNSTAQEGEEKKLPQDTPQEK